MSDILRALVLGIVQGLTEFLPVSSSGHLEILNALMGGGDVLDSDFTMVLLVHLGTALSIVWVFRADIVLLIASVFKKDINDPQLQFVGKVILSMIPALIVGLAWEERVEALFDGGIMHIGFLLIFTGLILWVTPQIQNKDGGINWKMAILIGVAQAVAILPGISRSGMTIAAALMLGSGKREAARFSFIMVLPVIFGKIILDLLSGQMTINTQNALPIVLALLSSFVVGVIACKWMIQIVQRSKLRHFAIYCGLVGILVIGLSFYEVI